MASQLQLRRGTTVQHGPFIGAPAEVTVDTDKKTLVVHDGTTPGGFPVLSASGGTMTGPVSMGGSKITSLATPTAPADAAPKGYVDGLIAAATLADADYGDITVSGAATVWTIDNNAVTAAKIASGAVTDAKIANDAVTTAKIASGAVTEAKIANDAVTTAKILNANVTDAKIATDAVTTAKIANGAVTTAKIASIVATGSTAPRSVQDRFSDVVNVKDFGAAGNGTTDDTAAIQAALNAASGKTIDLCGLVYKISSTLSVPSNVCIRNGTLNGSTMANGDTLMEISGTLGGATAMNTITNSASSFVVSSATGISSNSYLYLQSTTVFGEGATTNGEFVKVRTIVGTTVTPYRRIYDDYLANQQFYKPTLVTDVLLDNLHFIGGGNGAGHIAVSAYLASNVIFTNCFSEYFADRHFQFLRCVNSKAIGCTAIHSDASTGLAYGFVVGNGCENISIIGCTGNDVRHGVTIGAENGVDRNICVSGCAFSDCTDSAIDTHPQSQFVVFEGNVCGCDSTQATLDGIVSQGTDCVIANNIVQGFSRVGILIQPSCVNSSFCDNTVCTGNSVTRPIGSSDVYGISYDNRAAGSFCRSTINGNIIRTTSAAGNGIWFEISSNGNAVAGLVISNNNVVTRRVGISIKTNGLKFVRCGSISGNSVESLSSATYDAISISAATLNYIERIVIAANSIFGGRYGINNTNGGRIVAYTNMIQNAATAATNGLTATADNYTV